MLTGNDITDALRACFDPALGLDLVELGMVERIALALDADAPGAGIPGVPPRQCLTLTLLPTSHEDDAKQRLQAQVLNRLAGLEGLSRIELYLADDPLWTPARITPQGRRALQAAPLQLPILNNRIG